MRQLLWLEWKDEFKELLLLPRLLLGDDDMYAENGHPPMGDDAADV